MDLLKKELGPEGDLSVKLSQGKVVLEAKHVHQSGSASLLVEQDAEYFFKKLAEKIPGTLDDALIGVIVSAVKAMP